MKKETKVGLLTDLCFSIPIGAGLAVAGAMATNLTWSFTPQNLLLRFGIGFGIALIVGLIPFARMNRFFYSKRKGFAYVLSGLIADIAYAPLIAGVMAYVMVTMNLNYLNQNITYFQNRTAELEASITQTTDDYYKLTDEHEQTIQERTNEEEIFEEMKNDRQNRMKILKEDIDSVPKDETIEKTLREYMTKLLETENNTEEILKDYSAKISNEIDKARNITDTSLQNETLRSLNESFEFADTHLKEYYALMDMIKTIEKQKQKVEDLQAKDMEQFNQLNDMYDSIHDMKYEVANITQWSANCEQAKPDLKTSIINTEIYGCIAGLILCILMFPISEKIVTKMSEPSAPKAKKPKAVKKSKEKDDTDNDTDSEPEQDSEEISDDTSETASSETELPELPPTE